MKKLEQKYYAKWMVLPALILFMVFFIIPNCASFVMGFTDWSLFFFDDPRWCGFDNFIRLFGEKNFWVAVKNTFYFAIVTVIGKNVFGFLLAIANKLLMRRPTWLIVRQKLLLRIPIMGSLMRGQKLTQIFTILALTQSAGITFLQGVESVRETMRCPYWVQLLTQIQHDISNGHPIWLALKNTGEFSPLCLQLVRTGEASGSLDLMLDNLAHHHRENTMALADNLAALLEPALLIITGGIIGTLVVAMYLPIFHLGDAMSGMG